MDIISISGISKTVTTMIEAQSNPECLCMMKSLLEQSMLNKDILENLSDLHRHLTLTQWNIFGLNSVIVSDFSNAFVAE